MCISSVIVSIVAVVVAAAVLVSSSPINPDVPMCVAVAPNNKMVNLSTIATVTYSAQLATAQGLQSVKVTMGWCKVLSNATKCNNQTGLAMAIQSTDEKQCIAAFTAVSGPALPLSNTSFQLSEWSAGSGSIATITVNCDPSIPAGTANLTGVITNSPFFTFGITFISAAACTSSSSSQQQQQHVLRHVVHHHQQGRR